MGERVNEIRCNSCGCACVCERCTGFTLLLRLLASIKSACHNYHLSKHAVSNGCARTAKMTRASNTSDFAGPKEKTMLLLPLDGYCRHESGGMDGMYFEVLAKILALREKGSTLIQRQSTWRCQRSIAPHGKLPRSEIQATAQTA